MHSPRCRWQKRSSRSVQNSKHPISIPSPVLRTHETNETRGVAGDISSRDSGVGCRRSYPRAGNGWGFSFRHDKMTELKSRGRKRRRQSLTSARKGSEGLPSVIVRAGAGQRPNCSSPCSELCDISSAVNTLRRPGDVSGVSTGQPYVQCRDLFRLALAFQRDRFGQLRLIFRC